MVSFYHRPEKAVAQSAPASPHCQWNDIVVWIDLMIWHCGLDRPNDKPMSSEHSVIKWSFVRDRLCSVLWFGPSGAGVRASILRCEVIYLVLQCITVFKYWYEKEKDMKQRMQCPIGPLTFFCSSHLSFLLLSCFHAFFALHLEVWSLDNFLCIYTLEVNLTDSKVPRAWHSPSSTMFRTHLRRMFSRSHLICSRGTKQWSSPYDDKRYQKYIAFQNVEVRVESF